MGWFNWFKKPEKKVEAPAVVLPTEAAFVALLLDGREAKHVTQCLDKTSARAAAKAWAATVEGAYHCQVYWGQYMDLITGFPVGDKWPWSYEGPNYIVYSGVVSAPDRNAAYRQIVPKLREALKVTHLGRIKMRIGMRADEYVDYNEVTLP